MSFKSLVEELTTKPFGWINVNAMAEAHHMDPHDVTATLAQLRGVQYSVGEGGQHFMLSQTETIPTALARPSRSKPAILPHPYGYHGIGSNGPNGNGRGRGR